jgi:UPF0716 protein FxsA
MPLLVALFVAVPLVELYVIIQVGQEIGALWTVALLFAASVVGSVLLRSQGRTVWRRFRAQIEAGRPPAREVADGALIMLGGALLLTPGFVTDAFGLALLVPPTRALVRGVIVRRLTLGLVGGRRRRGYDVDGTATEVDRERLP